MKKYLSICMLLFTSILISQFVEHKPANNDWDIYPETEINYSNGKEDLKEILTLQSLLAEDRVDEMFKMMGKFGYIPIPNSENAYWKYTIDNNINENEMEPIIYIKNLGSNNNYYENYLQVFFSLIVKDNLSSGVSRTLKVNYKQAARMNNLFYNLFSFGNNYRTLKHQQKPQTNYRKHVQKNMSLVDFHIWSRYLLLMGRGVLPDNMT